MSPESTAPSGQALPAGTRLEEFEVERVLGTGGFGITYLARDTSLGRKVVIKENLPSAFAFRDTASGTVRSRSGLTEDEDNFRWSMENFLREADTLASLDHPGIVPVLRKFEANGTAYFVMPYMEGLPLDELMKNRRERGEEISDDELRGLLEHVLDALGYLHARGIYHRDIKPGNILVTKEGVPILIDFGSARQRLSERSMTVVESAGYTPFEQLQSRGNVGPWSDLYSLGATVAKAITGEAPPKAADRILDDPWVALAQRGKLRGRYSGELLESIDRALDPQVSPRFQEAGGWLRALQGERIAPGRDGSTSPATPAKLQPSSEEVPGSPAGVPVSVGAVSPGPKGKGKGLLVVVAAAALLAMVGVGVVLTGNTQEEEERVSLAQEEKVRLAQEERVRLAQEEKVAARKKAEAAEAARKKVEEELAARKKAEEERKRREAVITKALELVVLGEKFAPDFFTQVDREVLSSAAEGSDPRAQYVWGRLHDSSVGLLNDDKEAVKWYRKAAEQDYAPAQYNLGVMYATGRGVAKDDVEAVKWYRKAAEQGVALAQANLGWMYASGRGVAEDDAEAVKWYRKAAAQGDAKAKAALRRLGVRE